MKKCPYCAEEIQDEAIFCRYCRRDLAPAAAALPDKPAVRRRFPLTPILVVLLIVILLIAVGYAINLRNLNAEVVRVQADYVDQLLLIDRPISVSVQPEPGKDFEYTGFVKVGQTCDVLEVVSYKSELQYKLNCGGLIGWLSADTIKVIR